MIEILLLSLLGFGGSAIAAAFSMDDDDDDSEVKETETESMYNEYETDDEATDGGMLSLCGLDDLELIELDSDQQSGAQSEAENETDIIDGTEKSDLIAGGADADNLTYWTGQNEVSGGAGDDEIRGGFDTNESNTVSGDEGDDTIIDGDADALIFGGTGDDTITSGHGAGEIYGGDGSDHIETGIHTDLIHGDAGDDVLTAIGTDVEGETDLLYGDDGDDTLHIRGTTEAYGGEGSDTFVSYFNTWVEDAPVVQDFNADEDLLEVDIFSHGAAQQLDDFAVRVEDFTDGDGASIFVDDVEVMRIPGAQGLELSDVRLNLV